jgi:hypothetical protein
MTDTGKKNPCAILQKNIYFLSTIATIWIFPTVDGGGCSDDSEAPAWLSHK